MKNEIESKIAKEECVLSTIKAQLSKNETLTTNMVNILNSFDSRLHKLEDTIVPVYKQTGCLQRMQENVEKTLSSLDHVISYYKVAEDVEPIIINGPSGHLDMYLQSMARVQNAIDFFNKDDLHSCGLELTALQKFFERGKDALEREFSNLLKRHSKPVSPITIIDIIGIDEEFPAESDHDTLAWEHIPERVLVELNEISKWLQSHGSMDFLTIYAQVRSNMLVRSVTGMKEHMKKSSGSSGASVAYNPSPLMPRTTYKMGTKDTPTKRNLKKPSMIRKASTLMKHGSHHTLEVGHKRTNSTSSYEFKDEASEIDTDTYMSALSALLKLIQSEAKLLTHIIPERNQRMIFDQLIQKAFDLVIAEGENIAIVAKRHLAKHEFSALIMMFPVIKHLRNLKPDFDEAVQGTQPSTRAKVPNLISKLHANGDRALEEYIDMIRSDPDKHSNMPSDGTVHELVSNTTTFLEHLVDNLDTVGGMLAAQEPSARGNVNDVDCNKRMLSAYIMKVLGALQLNLQLKAKAYDQFSLAAVFLMNNYNYILKALMKGELINLVHIHDVNVETSYNTLINEQRDTYVQSWNKVIELTLEKSKPAMSVQRTSQAGCKLKDRERQGIKEKFKSFNDEFEEMYDMHKGYAIPDKKLRQSLRKNNIELVLPAYSMFVHKYNNVQFSKNPEKYIKYTTEDVQDMLNKFFDVSA